MPFVDQLPPAVDEPRLFGAVLQRAARNLVVVLFVGLSQIRRVGVGNRPLASHPVKRCAGVEAAGKRDADLLAGWNTLKNRRHLAANDINGRGAWQIMRRRDGSRILARPLRRLPSLALSPPVVIAAVGVLIVVLQWASARPLWLDEQMIALNVRDRGLASLGGRLWLDQSAPLGWLLLQRTRPARPGRIGTGVARRSGRFRRGHHTGGALHRPTLAHEGRQRAIRPPLLGWPMDLVLRDRAEVLLGRHLFRAAAARARRRSRGTARSSTDARRQKPSAIWIGWPRRSATGFRSARCSSCLPAMRCLRYRRGAIVRSFACSA